MDPLNYSNPGTLLKWYYTDRKVGSNVHMCVRGIGCASLSPISVLDLGTVQTVWSFLVWFYSCYCYTSSVYLVKYMNTYIKWKTQYHKVGTNTTFNNREIVEKETKFDTPNTHIFADSLSWLDKEVRLNQFHGPKPLHLCLKKNY